MTLLTTFSLLSLFLYISTSSLSHITLQSSSLKNYQKSFNTRQQDYNEYQEELFNNYQPKVTQPKASVKHLTASVENHPPLTSKKVFKTSGINLYQLLNKSQDSKHMEDWFCALIHNLYQGTSFYEDDLAQKLLKELRQHLTFKSTASKKNSSREITIKRLEDIALLEFEDPHMQLAFYKMLKGNTVAGLKGGYPSILDFLHINKRVDCKINLVDSKQELLAIIFDPNIAQKIMEQRPSWKKDLKNKKVLEQDSALYDFLQKNQISNHENIKHVVLRID